MNAPEPGKGQIVHQFTLPDGLLDVPLVCHLHYEPPNDHALYGDEYVSLDKVFAGYGGGNIYHLVLEWKEQIENEALAALKASRVEID